MSETFDFRDGNGPVPARRHRNPDGSLGGWVARTAFVSTTAFIGPDARVFNWAKISNNAKILGHARVYHNAEVQEDACVSDQAQVYGSAKVWGSALVSEQAQVRGFAAVTSGARLFGSVVLDGAAHVLSGARLGKTDDVRFGDGWTAYRTETGYVFADQYRMTLLDLNSWEELPKMLHQKGFISTMEYLAQALEQEREQKPEPRT